MHTHCHNLNKKKCFWIQIHELLLMIDDKNSAVCLCFTEVTNTINLLYTDIINQYSQYQIISSI